jgi:hypothetical protein
MGVLDFLLASRTRVRGLSEARKRPSLVSLDNRSLLQRQGWKKQGSGFVGEFRTPRGGYPGVIERRGDVFRVFIRNPPLQGAMKHWHRDCLRFEGRGWWSLHLQRPPRNGDVNAIIHYVEERFLRECLALGR